MRTRAIVLIAGLFLLLAGCAPRSNGGPRINANLITSAEIVEMGPSNAFNIIQALRSNWLQKRGRTSFTDEGEIWVYVDGTGPSSMDILRGIHSDNIESLAFLDERRATYRFGSGHEHGAILVTLKGE